MKNVSIKHVDVFTSVPFKGNPVAVVLDGSEFSTSQMQSLANWTNLSETTFVLPPKNAKADYSVRIFTPMAEMPFAGHPTLGTAHAVMESGLCIPKKGILVQECEVGLVKVRVEREIGQPSRIYFNSPKAVFHDLSENQRTQLIELLGVPIGGARFVNVGPNHTVIQLESAEQVLALKPDFAKILGFSQKYDTTGLLIFGRYNFDKSGSIETRAFFPILGVNEDPVCGSGNGAIAAFLKDTGQLTVDANYVATQGSAIGRAGYVNVIYEGEDVFIGGECITCADGTLVN